MIAVGAALANSLQSSESYNHFWGGATWRSLFDLSSLTKILVTSPLLVEHAKKNYPSLQKFYEVTLSDILTELRGTPLEKIPLRNFWEHRAGLSAHFLLGGDQPRQPFVGSRDEMWKVVIQKILAQGLKADTTTEYSDLSFWLLGAFLERVEKKSIADLWTGYKKAHSLAEQDLIFLPPEMRAPVACEKRHPVGSVNDDNAAWMGGVAPHAGLFASVSGIMQFLEFLNQHRKNDPWYHDFCTAKGNERFYCGWDRPSTPDTQAGKGAPKESTIGHLGFTGTALWWDPASEWAGILLTNRIFPMATPENQREIREYRIKFFSLLWHNKRQELWSELQKQLPT